jgi:hypothetical protein
MIKYLEQQPKLIALILFTIVAYAINKWAGDALMDRYIASGFPVPYFEAQLSFDAAKLKGWYAYLIERKSLQSYITTQHFDYLFMLSMLLFNCSAVLVVSRFFRAGSKGRKIVVYCALISAFGPIFDAFENAVSYVMLANPVGFSSWLAIVYSSFAASKFAVISFSYLVMIIGTITGLAGLAWNRFRAQAETPEVA